jgi:Fungal specific transcription factor domain
MWLALTYSMMMIVLISYNRFGEEPLEYKGRTEQMYRDYKRLVGQSLMLIDVTHPTNYLLETLVLYVIADVGKTKDPDFNVLTGVTLFVRLAMKMGYHRDSKYFPNISPFDGEMRRRVWAMVQHSDLRISSQFGLPPVARSDMINTAPPSNLYDDEISQDLEFLPPSRPPTEATPISYTIYKTKLTLVAVEIVEESQKLGKPSYETVMTLDRKLKDVNDKIPPHLRMRMMEESIRDPAVLIMKRYILEIMYLRYLCLLHRKFSGCSRYPYSNRTCVESAMEILKHQRVLHAENRPGGRIADAKMLFTSLSTQDFLLAAMIVAMDLYRSAEAERSGRSPMDQQEKYDRASMISAIEQSLHFWDAFKDDSIDALKATGALTVMLAMLRDQETQRGQPEPADVKTEIPPEHSAAMTLEMLSSGGAMAQGAPGVFAATSGLDAAAVAAAAPSMAQPFLQPGVGLGGAAQVPFSSWLNGANSGFQPLDLSNDVDWVSLLVWWVVLTVQDAIDSYITSGNSVLLEPGNVYGTSIWPVNFDPAMDPSAADPVSPQASMPLDPAVLGTQAPVGFGFGGVTNAGAR